MYQKIARKLVQKQQVQSLKNSRITPATNLKKETYITKPNFITQN